MSGGLCECGCGAATRLAPRTDPAKGWERGKPLRFILGHQARTRSLRPFGEALWERVDKSGECWLFTGYLDAKGYGRLTVVRDGVRRSVLPHRLSYELRVGPIPVGLELDHLCRVRNCVNPRHLEPVTHAENNRRAMRDACPQGHLWDEANTAYARNGSRRCRACNRARHQRRRAQLEAAS